jgi:hypothetical protein
MRTRGSNVDAIPFVEMVAARALPMYLLLGAATRTSKSLRFERPRIDSHRAVAGGSVPVVTASTL